MRCPVCNVDLMIADRQGIEIDFCPKCRGVWLDRGELDKIIERSFSAPPPQAHTRVVRENVSYNAPPPVYHEERHGRHEGHHYPKKRKSFLEDIFDFD